MGRTLTVPGRQVLPSSAGPALGSPGAAPLNAFGGSSRGLIQAGERLGSIGAEMANEAVRLQRDENERVSKNLDVMFGEAIRKIQYGEKEGEGYFSQMGENALNSFDSASTAIDEAMKEVAGSTTNRRAIDLFQRAAQVRKLAALNSMSGHREKQRLVASAATSDARISSASDDVAVSKGDPDTVNRSRTVIQAEIMDQAEKQGWSPEVAREKLSSAYSAMHYGAVISLFRDDPVNAQIYYNTHLGDINGETRAKVDNLLRDSVIRVRSQELFDKYLREYDNEADMVAAIRRDTSGEVEDVTVARAVAHWQMVDRQKGRAQSEISQQRAEENQAYTEEVRDAQEQAPELAAEVKTEAKNYSDALRIARERYDGPLYTAVEAQLTKQYQAEKTDEPEAVKAHALLVTNGLIASGKSEVEMQTEVNQLFTGTLRDEILRLAGQHFAAKEREEKRVRKDARVSAFSAVNGGKSFDEWAKENPEHYAVIAQYAGDIDDVRKEEARVAKDALYAPVTDGQTFEYLRSLPAKSLVDTNLIEYRGKLTEDEYRDIVKMQTSVSKELERDEQSRAAYTARDRAISDAVPAVRKGGKWVKELDPKIEARVRNQVTMFIEQFREENDGKPPTTPQIELEVQRLMLPIVSDPPGFGFNEIEVGDKVYGVNAAQELTDEQIQYARVPFENIPDQMVNMVRGVVAETGVPYSVELVERFAALRAMNLRSQAEELLGVRR